MKKLIYFFTITILTLSCNVSKEIYDDVYDQAELTPTSQVDENNGYSDYIKKEEHKYTVKPEENHYSYISTEEDNSNNEKSNASITNHNDYQYFAATITLNIFIRQIPIFVQPG